MFVFAVNFLVTSDKGGDLEGITLDKINDNTIMDTYKSPTSSEQAGKTTADSSVESGNSGSEYNNDITTDVDYSVDGSMEPSLTLYM